jgi:FKBP-type peptidyl-prolyl cis-trans isomerase
VREGTKLQIKIPAKLAYGQQGVSSMGIPPNADLIFKVEVLKVT